MRLIDGDQCPRCERQFDPAPIGPAGSRVTYCRCIPICGRCGQHEAVCRLVGPAYWSSDDFFELDVRMELATRMGLRTWARIEKAEAAERQVPYLSGWKQKGN